MSRVAVLKAIFIGNRIVAGTGQTVQVTAENLGGISPKKCWVTRQECCGIPGVVAGLTFEDPSDTNAIVGFFLNLNGVGVVVDLDAPQTLVDYLNECCDGTAVLAGNSAYTSGFPAYNAAATSSYCISRADDGSPYAANQFAMDYIDKISSSKTFSASGTLTKYTVTAFKKPVPQGTDTIANAVCS